jgi:hypothetical protein
MNPPRCTNIKCPRSEVVWCYERGPAAVATSNIFMCKTCRMVMFEETPAYERYNRRLAFIEAARREESEYERKRRRFQIFFGGRIGARDATRRFE